MRKILLFVLTVIFYTTTINAQITTTSVGKPDVVAEKTVTYDSTKNWLGDKNVESYIGQTLYVNNPSNKYYKYDNFYKEIEIDQRNKRRKKTPVKSKVNIKPEDLYGKYFIVAEVHKDTSRFDFIESHSWTFLLYAKDSVEKKVWFTYSEEYNHLWPFIVVSHFEYLKKEHIGKKYVLDMLERKTSKITPSLTDVWECIDVTIEDERYQLVLLVKNQKGQTSFIIVRHLEQLKDGRHVVYEKSIYDDYVKQYGIENMNKIRQRKISIGMTPDMLKLSWG